MAASGYNRATNPELSKNGAVIYFPQAISAAAQTRESIQLALTRATPDRIAPINNERSLISAFREAGFKTAWLSNQNKLSDVDTPLYAVAKEADFVYFTNGDYNKNTRFDDKLLAPLNDYLRNTRTARNLIIIHTMGSHEVYRQRYPEQFARFQPASTGDDYNFASAGIRERLLNSYDNSMCLFDTLTETAGVQLSQPKTGCNLAAPLTREYDWLVLGASYNPLRYRDIPPAQLADEPEATKGKVAVRGRVQGTADKARAERKL